MKCFARLFLVAALLATLVACSTQKNPKDFDAYEAMVAHLSKVEAVDFSDTVTLEVFSGTEVGQSIILQKTQQVQKTTLGVQSFAVQNKISGMGQEQSSAYYYAVGTLYTEIENGSNTPTRFQQSLSFDDALRGLNADTYLAFLPEDIQSSTSQVVGEDTLYTFHLDGRKVGDQFLSNHGGELLKNRRIRFKSEENQALTYELLLDGNQNPKSQKITFKGSYPDDPTQNYYEITKEITIKSVGVSSGDPLPVDLKSYPVI